MLTSRFAAALDRWITREPPAEEPCFCARCTDRTDRAEPATAEQAAQSGFPQIGEGDLLCPTCAEVLTADAVDAAMSGAPEADRGDACGTLCDECGRHMADPRGPTCTGCLASWFTPGVTVARDVSEGPRPVIFDGFALVARAA